MLTAYLQSLFVLCVLFTCAGATCSWARRQTLAEFAPPVVFQARPSLDLIQQYVNRSLQINSLESNNLKVSGPELAINLSGELKWQRPHNFLFEAYAGTKMMGTAMAAGSNQDMFWLKTQLPPPPTLYFARHDEFENLPGPRQILPVSPLWLREALGVIEMDPSLVHQEPIEQPNGRFEVVSMIPSPRGAYRRHVVLDPRTGVIEETKLYNHAGVLVASAQQTEHQYYSAIDFTLPHKVDVQLQSETGGNKLAFTIEVGFYLINQPLGSTVNPFVPPESSGLTKKNLVTMDGIAATGTPPRYTPETRGSHIPVMPASATVGSPVGNPRDNAWQTPDGRTKRSLFPGF